MSSLFSRRRSVAAGSTGALRFCLSAHQVSQEPTAARLRFQVEGATWLQSVASASQISSSSTPASVRSGPSCSPVRSSTLV
ncbi:hypothetical protein [Kibdelosporangium phytohabitans]|uniref:Uncharacterized protein n=1 Tax=Kibdelosporangium phytohabitans TaxID=860235 RepID=A0A0N9I2L5_9PSEU|nr:hypothetical protein [Kibdelosporangium phytohabitans]ALG10083.1 hypothetical protein AOZ06_27135 [Kibdelosporangium phytohabitans]MBE1461062.1 hypothetical protein [Kibdelosporangium phytohabitans]